MEIRLIRLLSITKFKNDTDNVISENQENHTGCSSSINQQRTFIHHKTGQPTTMKTASIGRSQAARQTNLPAEVVQVLQEFEIPIQYSYQNHPPFAPIATNIVTNSIRKMISIIFSIPCKKTLII